VGKKSSQSGRSVTTGEIARLCGVSRTTVSAVLNGKRSVREKTRSKVLDCIRLQNYDSGMIAKTLVGELSQMVAVLSPELGNPFHMMVFQGINEVLAKEGYHILLHSVRKEDQPDPQTMESLHAYAPAGYIIINGAQGPNGIHARVIAEEGVPMVTHGRLDGLETHSVSFDNRLAMKRAADYVIGKGHSSLAHLAGPTYSVGAKERKLGFIESLIEHDIPVHNAIIVDAGETIAPGYLAALEMLKDPLKRPTAVLCFNDLIAMGVYRAAHELSIDIPGDLSVTGFDGIDFAGLLGPPLTTVDLFPTEVGRLAARLLLKVIRNQVGRGYVTELIETQLVERASVRHYTEVSEQPAYGIS
jgi:DNA-binding LacI/PurR family transcriptional regulator